MCEGEGLLQKFPHHECHVDVILFRILGKLAMQAYSSKRDDTHPLTLLKMSSFLSTISCKNCGAIHREDALVLMLTDDATGGDARHADPFSASPTTAPDNDDATGEGVKGG